MEFSNIQSKEICKYRTGLNYFTASRNEFLSPSWSKILLRGVICLPRFKIKYTTRIKRFISCHSRANPLLRVGAFFLTQVLLKTFWFFHLPLFCPPYIFLYNADEIVFYPILVRKNLYKLVYSLLLLNNKFFSMTSSYRNHYNYLFRFFCFIRFSMSICYFLCKER